MAIDQGGFTVQKFTGQKIRVRLDWSRMLGFDQARRSANGIDAASLTKVGIKPAVHTLASAASTLGSKIGVKIGTKLVRSS